MSRRPRLRVVREHETASPVRSYVNPKGVRALLGALKAEAEAARNDDAATLGDASPPSTSAIVLDAQPREAARPRPLGAPRPAPSQGARWGLAAAGVGFALASSLVLHAARSSPRAAGPSAAAALVGRASPIAIPADGNALPILANAEGPASPQPEASAERSSDAHATPEPTKGTIRVAVDGHRVFIDGRYAGEGAGTYATSFGKHTVRVGSVGEIRTMDIRREGEVVIETTGFQADVVPDAACAWEPYEGAWACALPEGFKLGRFDAPPDFRHKPASIAAREHAWEVATSAPGAKPGGHLGAFVPKSGGGWLFVPGTAWSPNDPVYLPGTRGAPGAGKRSRGE